MAKTETAVRRGGRKKNKWTLVTFVQLNGFIDLKQHTQKAVAAHLGVTNSTFHNWKNGRCAPDEEVQGKIKALIDGKEKITVTKKKAKKKSKRAPRGAGSSTLAALAGKTTAGERKPVVPRKAKKVKTVSVRSHGRVQKAGFGDWGELKTLGKFLRANPGKSSTDIVELIDTLKTAAAVLG